MTVRNAEADEINLLAQIWFDGWQDAHADILPAALARLRTMESFRERLGALLPSTRVAGPRGAPAGFAIVKRDELNQLYVSPKVRGTGVAATLMDDALARLRENGGRTAWLACAIGNARAARFYEKQGWNRTGVMTSKLETPEGVSELDVWRYEIPLPV